MNLLQGGASKETSTPSCADAIYSVLTVLTPLEKVVAGLDTVLTPLEKVVAGLEIYRDRPVHHLFHTLAHW